MSIWVERPTVAALAGSHVDTLVSHIGIEFVEVGDDFLIGRMPADARTHQPYGIVHGGASVVLAETLGSCGAAWSVERARFLCVGQEINANHLRPVRAGWVTGEARPVHIGRRSQVWGIELRDDSGKLSCICRLTMAVIEKTALR